MAFITQREQTRVDRFVESMKTITPKQLNDYVRSQTPAAIETDVLNQNSEGFASLQVIARYNPNRDIFDIIDKKIGNVSKYLADDNKYMKAELTPLFLAASYNTAAVVQTILALVKKLEPAQLLIRDARGKTALHYAAKNNLDEAVTATIFKTFKALPNRWYSEKQFSLQVTPLFEAVRYNANEKVTKVLIDFHSDINFIGVDDSENFEYGDEYRKKNYTESLLYRAAKYNNNEKVLRALLIAGANPKWKDKNNMRPFDTAAVHTANPLVIEEFLRAGVDPNSFEIQSPLTQAVRFNPNERVIQTLLQAVGPISGPEIDISIAASISNANENIFNLLYSQRSANFNFSDALLRAVNERKRQIFVQLFRDAPRFGHLFSRELLARALGADEIFTTLLENADLSADMSRYLLRKAIIKNTPQMFEQLLAYASVRNHLTDEAYEELLVVCVDYINRPFFLRVIDFGDAQVENLLADGRALLRAVRLASLARDEFSDYAKDEFVSLLVFFGSPVSDAMREEIADLDTLIEMNYCRKLAFNIIKQRATEIVIAFQNYIVDYNRMLYILREDADIRAIAKRIPDHYLFELIVTIKYAVFEGKQYSNPIKKTVQFKIRQIIDAAETEQDANTNIKKEMGREPNDAEKNLIAQKLQQRIDSANTREEADEVIKRFLQREPNEAEAAALAQRFSS